MAKQILTLALISLAIALSAVIAGAQGHAENAGEGDRNTASLRVTAAAGKDHIRFVSPGIGQRMRFGIVNQAGNTAARERVVASAEGGSMLAPGSMVSVSSSPVTGALTGSVSSDLTGSAARVQDSSGSPGRVLYSEGPSNTLFGQGAGISLTSGAHNSFFGLNAGNATTGGTDPSGSYNSFFGSQAGRSNTTGSYNSFFGLIAGYENTTGSSNSFIGAGAGNGNTTGTGNSFIGRDAGFSNTTGNYNSFLGIGAGKQNSTGYSNSFFGSGAGYLNTTGYLNSFFGDSAGTSNTTGWENSFFGSGAGNHNETGVGNSFFGSHAGLSNVGGENWAGGLNSFFGYNAGMSNTTGMVNSFFGEEAGRLNTTGGYNSFVGSAAGFYNTTGSGNTFIGKDAGYNSSSGANTVESYNTLLGASTLGAAAITNGTAIGYRARVTRSNSLVLGSINGINGAAADTNVGIGTTAPLARLHVQNGDIYMGSAGQGMILKSPDGTKCAKLSIDDSGTLVTMPQACPGSSTPPSQVLYAAQFANGDGVISEVVLCNPSTTEAVSGRASFFDNAGLPMTVGISGSSATTSMDFSLPPLGMSTFSTDGSGKLSSGSLQVSSDSSVAGFVRFNLPGIGVAGVGSSQPVNTFIAPVRGKMGSIYSGIAVQNIESSPVTVNLSLRDRSGTIIPNGTITVPDLAASGHFAKFIHELFPQAALDDFEGSLTAEAVGGRIAATALELGSAPGQFTTLPVAPLR